jgi:hypothetical protein
VVARSSQPSNPWPVRSRAISTNSWAISYASAIVGS